MRWPLITAINVEFEPRSLPSRVALRAARSGLGEDLAEGRDIIFPEEQRQTQHLRLIAAVVIDPRDKERRNDYPDL